MDRCLPIVLGFEALVLLDVHFMWLKFIVACVCFLEIPTVSYRKKYKENPKSYNFLVKINTWKKAAVVLFNELSVKISMCVRRMMSHKK